MFAFRRMLVVWIVCISCSVWMGGGGAGCTRDPSNGSAVVGAAGGKVSSADGKLTLDIPAGALSADTSITLAPASPNDSTSSVPSAAYVMGPDGLTFAKPVTATLRISTTDLAGVDLKKERLLVYLYTKSGSTSEFLSDIQAEWGREKDVLVLSGQLSHFSELRVIFGFYSFVMEGIENQKITMEVGEFRSFRTYLQQKTSIPKGFTALLKVTEMNLNNTNDIPNAPDFFSIAHPIFRGASLSKTTPPRQPYHRTLGNVFRVSDQLTNATFDADPPVILECLSVGTGALTVLLGAEDNLQRNDDKAILTGRFDVFKGGRDIFQKISFKVPVHCVAPTTTIPEPADGTIHQVRKIHRRDDGDAMLIGKEGLARHAGDTTKRKGVIILGDGIVDEAGADFGGDEDDFSVVLQADPPTPDALAGKVVSVLQRPNGATQALKLDAQTQAKTFTEIKPICPTETDKPCKTHLFSVVDVEGALYRFAITPKTFETILTPIAVPKVDKVATAEIRQTATGFKGVVVARGGGDVVAFTETNGSGITAEFAGATKPGKYLLQCNVALSHCAVGNTDGLELFVLAENTNTKKWGLLWSEQVTEAFNALDLFQRVQGELALLLTHPKRNAVTKVDLDSAGMKVGMKLIQTECSALRVAVFANAIDHYLAACEEGNRGVLLRRKFVDQVPAEPVASKEDSEGDAGTTEQTVQPEQNPPDPSVDCSKYRYTGKDRAYPMWYAGSISDPVCAAMYDKLYGQNGQDINCQTDADCKNPCRYICCGQGLRLELIVCKGGQCRAEISNKCDFCDGTSTGFGGCGLPPNYTP